MFFFPGASFCIYLTRKNKDFNTLNFQRAFVEKWPLSATFPGEEKKQNKKKKNFQSPDFYNRFR
jgi:hypothetical protein